MRKTSKFVPIYIGFLLLFSGCGDEASTTSETAQAPVPTVEANQPRFLAGLTVMEAIDFLKDHMRADMTVDEIDKLTGCQKIEVIRALDGKIAYRYDILKSDNYVYAGSEPLYDDIDTEGLKENVISLIMFISFDDDDCLSSYSLHYYDDGEVREFHSDC